MESATGRLAARVGQIFGASGEVVTSPVVFWRWLTAGGSDPTGPWRALAGGFMLIAIGWREHFIPKMRHGLGREPALADYLPVAAAPYYLQNHYIVANPHPEARRKLLDDAADGS